MICDNWMYTVLEKSTAKESTYNSGGICRCSRSWTNHQPWQSTINPNQCYNVRCQQHYQIQKSRKTRFRIGITINYVLCFLNTPTKRKICKGLLILMEAKWMFVCSFQWWAIRNTAGGPLKVTASWHLKAEWGIHSCHWYEGGNFISKLVALAMSMSFAN